MNKASNDPFIYMKEEDKPSEETMQKIREHWATVPPHIKRTFTKAAYHLSCELPSFLAGIASVAFFEYERGHLEATNYALECMGGLKHE